MSNLSEEPVNIRRVRLRAIEIAKTHNHDTVTLEHLLLAMMEEDDVTEALKAFTASPDAITSDMVTFLGSGFISQIIIPDMEPVVSHLFQQCVVRAAARGSMDRARGGVAQPIYLLATMLEMNVEDSFAVTALVHSGLDAVALKRYISNGGTPPNYNSSPSGFFSASNIAGFGDEVSGTKDVKTIEEAIGILNQFCVNLNEVAMNGKIDPLIGRETEVSRMIQVMARRTTNNIVLVGEPGVGKTAIAEGLVKKIVQGEVPDVLASSTVFSLDIGSMMAGTRYRGDLEERMRNVLKALALIEGAILFIDEIHTIMGTGASQGTLDIANLLKPALARGTLRCIGATTYDEYRKHFEKDRALLRRFKRIDVSEPDPETTKAILFGLKSDYEAFHNVQYTDEAIEAAVDLTTRYITNNALPDKAVDVMDSAGATQKVSPESTRLTVIGIEEIEAEVSKIAKIPAQTIKEDETAKLAHLEGDLKLAVFGQDAALESLVDAVFISRAGLRDANKPSGCFMFAGPTGVGKTESARQLAATLNVPLIRYDMSEYMEKHSVAKLIGSPPGYVGYGEGGAGSGKLINDIDTSPYAVLLIDEIEKAHPDIASIFLQIMDDGRLTSGSGKSVDFRNVILIMTTNAGARELVKSGIGFNASENSGDPTAEINRMFSPEFRNRLDSIVQFDRLQPENVIRVVDKFTATLREQALARNVTVEFSDAAKTLLARLGYDKNMGARPLARVIHEHVKKPLSREMLVGSLSKGGRAMVDVENDKIAVRVVPLDSE